ncbi:MAG: ATP-binding protein [Burkholderiaceae bacterium]
MRGRDASLLTGMVPNRRPLRLLPLGAAMMVILASLWLLRTRIQAPDLAFFEQASGPWWPMMLAVALVSASAGALLALAWASRRLLRGTQASRRPAASTRTRIDDQARLAGLPALAAPTEPLDTAAAWRLLLEYGRHGYWVCDPRGRYLRVEPAADQAGSRIRELIGQTSLPLPTEPESGRRPSAFALRRRRLVLSDGTRLTIEEAGRPMLAPDGRLLGYHGVIRDLSHSGEREPLTAVLAALSAAPLPAMLLRRQASDEGRNEFDWCPVWANHALTSLSEFSPGELQQRPLAQWLLLAGNGNGDDDAGDAVSSAGGPRLIRMLERRREACGSGLLLDRYGRRHEVAVTIEPLVGDDLRQLTMVLIDHQGPALAHLRARAERVESLEKSIAQRVRDTDWANHELEAFSHTVSHDLRQPIRQIAGFARILQEDHSELLDPTGRDHINRILNAAHRMAGMIEALMEMQRISAHAITRDRIDLSALANEVAEDLRQTHPGVAATFEIEPQVACRGERVLLRMLLANLFENAWKYSARSERRLIRFGTRVQDGQRVFEVADNGIGFDMRFADQIFSLFNRLHGRGEFQGNGVGLATVQRIVRRHQGRIWAESEPGKGSVFRFTLWENED